MSLQGFENMSPPSLFALTCSALILFANFVNGAAPSATVKNGTYMGKYVSEWEQDQFLGIPYAEPPVGPLRFARPRSLNISFSEARDATQYGYSCYQYGTTFNLSEDCLTLNGMSY